METVKASDLALGDKVSLTSPNGALSPYMTATVFQIKDEVVSLWRPYVVTSDFKTTAGVIPTIGIETVKLWTGDTRPLVRLELGGTIR